MRPVLEYASPCWQTSLTKEQTKQLEDVQRRALRVIFGNIPYDEARRTCNILSLAERRHELGKIFFPENYQGQVKRPLLHVSFASQARYSTNDSTAYVLDNIQQFMHGLIVRPIKTILFYLGLIISSDVILCIMCIHDFSVFV